MKKIVLIVSIALGSSFIAYTNVHASTVNKGQENISISVNNEKNNTLLNRDEKNTNDENDKSKGQNYVEKASDSSNKDELSGGLKNNVETTKNDDVRVG